MAGLILCKQTIAKNPFYIEELGISLYSGEELSYVIYNHPFIVLSGFLTEQLFTFLSEELGYSELSLLLATKFFGSKKTEEALFEILKTVNYYSIGEIRIWKDEVSRIGKLHPTQFLYEKASYFVSRNRLKKALSCLEELLANYVEEISDKVFLSTAYGMIAAIYSGLFEFKYAILALERSYSYHKKRETLKKIYFLSKIEDRLEISEEINTEFNEKEFIKWDKEFMQLKNKVIANGMNVKLMELLKKDSIQRSKGLEDILVDMKASYRVMV